MKHLLTEFFAEDCDVSVKHSLLCDVSEWRRTGVPSVLTRSFNRFDVTFDFDHRQALIEDDLDAVDEGSVRISLEDFVAALEQHATS